MAKKFLITDLDLNHTLVDELSEQNIEDQEDGEISIICLEDLTLRKDDDTWDNIPSE